MIDDDPRLDPDDLRSVRFPGSRRRYEAPPVDQFLASLADRVAATNALVDDLQRRLAEAEQGGEGRGAAAGESTSPFDKPDLAALSDDELVGLVGSETAHVLSTARRAADEIRTKAEEAAARVIREATANAQQAVEEAETASATMRAEAESARDDAVAAAEAAAAELRAQAADEVEAIKTAIREQADEASAAAAEVRAEAEADGERIREDARDEGRSMVQEAKAVRVRVLDDLQRRRDTARAQVETLLAGRARLLTAYERVRADLDLATSELEAAGPELDPDDGADALIEPLVDPVDPEESEDPDPDPDPPPTENLVDSDDLVAGNDEISDEDDADADADADAAEVEVAEDVDEEVSGEADEEVDAEDAVAAPTENLVDSDEGDQVDDAVDDDAAGEERDVDALFARIRAERAESVARAQRVLSGESDVVPATMAAEPELVADAATSAVESDAPDDVAPDAAEPGATGDVDHVPAEFLAAGPVHEARAAVVDELDAKLSRALKRHLADEQNEVLDRLRRSQSTEIDQLLPEAADHIAGYGTVALPELVAAATAGAATIDPDVAVDVTALADKLGATLIEPFRRRIERAADEVDGDADELDERLRAVYREWKVSHIGAATTDVLLSAFAQGQLAAAPEGSAVRWLIDPEQGPCPDAQDNALAGPVTAGEPFPTGDTCPQAHTGCRCLLVVDS